MNTEELRWIFDMIDVDRKGFITEQDLRRISTDDSAFKNKEDVEEITNLFNFGHKLERLDFDHFQHRIMPLVNLRSEQYEALGEYREPFTKVPSPFRLQTKSRNEEHLPSAEIVHHFKELLTQMEEMLDQKCSSIDSFWQSLPLIVEERALASETFVDERNSKRRLEVNEAEKSNLKLQLDLASEKIDLLESQLQDKSNELKQCRQDNTDLKRIIDYQSNSIENLSNHTNDMNLILSSMKSICGKDEEKVSQLKVQQTKCIQNRLALALERLSLDRSREQLMVSSQEKDYTSSIRPVIDIAVEASEPEDIWEKIESLQFENDQLKGELQETKKFNLSLQQSNDVYQKLMLEINEMVQSTSEA